MKTPPTAESMIERDGEGAAAAHQNPNVANALNVVDTFTETANFVGEISDAIASGTKTGASGCGEEVNGAIGVADALGAGAQASSPSADLGDCGGCDCACDCVVS